MRGGFPNKYFLYDARFRGLTASPTAASEPKKDFTQRRKDAKNTQQYVTQCLDICALAASREACLLPPPHNYFQ